MKPKTQTDTVLQHLRAERFITAWTAEGVYRIRRLASRIDELVAAGYDIVKERREDTTGQAYTRYSLSPRQRAAHFPLNPMRPREKLVGLSAVKEALEYAGANATAIKLIVARLEATA